MSDSSSDVLDQLDAQSIESGFLQSFSNWVAASLKRTLDMSEEVIKEQSQKLGADRPPPLNPGNGRVGGREILVHLEVRGNPLKLYPSIKLDFKEKNRLTSGSNYDVWALRMRGFLREENCGRLWMTHSADLH